MTQKQKPLKSTNDVAGKEKQTAKAFVNWEIPLKSGGVYPSSKGFPIYQNPKYKNAQEDYLVALAERHGGEITIDMRVTIKLYEPKVAPSVDDITIVDKAS